MITILAETIEDLDAVMHLTAETAPAGPFPGQQVQVVMVRPEPRRDRGWCVALLMASACPEHPGTRCVMEVLYRPGMTSREARALAGRVPEWTAPHIIPVTDPATWEWEGEAMTDEADPGGPFRPDWVVAPGATLADWMEEHGVSVAELARAAAADPADAASRAEAEQLVRDVLELRPLAGRHAAALCEGTGISTAFWLNYERTYRAGLAAGLKDVTRDTAPAVEGGGHG